MPLISPQEILLDAKRCGYAVGAFNIENMEYAMAVIEAAETMRSPVICAVSQNSFKYADAETYFGIVSSLAKKVRIPVALHLDHAETEITVIKAIRAGFTSIMIDGSKLNFEQNVQITKRVVDICKQLYIPVEGELGALAGKIDAVPEIRLIYTDPDAAMEFVKQTNVSSLAVAIGTAHGVYKDRPVLDTKRLSAINKKINEPLVLHGASGLTQTQVSDCISNGISKINYATELRIAYRDAIMEHLTAHPENFDPRKFGRKGIDAIKAVTKKKIIELGSADRC